MSQFKKVLISNQQPFFILKDSYAVVGETLESTTRHEASWLLDSEECDDIDINTGIVCKNDEAAVIKADYCNIVILSTSSTWYYTVSNFKEWSFIEQKNWSQYINTLI